MAVTRSGAYVYVDGRKVASAHGRLERGQADRQDHDDYLRFVMDARLTGRWGAAQAEEARLWLEQRWRACQKVSAS